MALRVTKSAAEVVTLLNPVLRVTKSAIEVVTGIPSEGSGTIADPVYAFPNVFPDSIEWRLFSNEEVTASPYSLIKQVLARGPQIWSVRLSFNRRADSERALLQSFLMRVRGQRYAFTLRDHGYVRRGTGDGTPLVMGGGQTGVSIVTDGWTASAVGVLLAGDLVQIRNQLCRVVDDVSADAGGIATIVVQPSIRIAPNDNLAIVTAVPLGLFRISTPDVGWSQNPGIFSDIEIQCTEEVEVVL